MAGILGVLILAVAAWAGASASPDGDFVAQQAGYLISLVGFVLIGLGVLFAIMDKRAKAKRRGVAQH